MYKSHEKVLNIWDNGGLSNNGYQGFVALQKKSSYSKTMM